MPRRLRRSPRCTVYPIERAKNDPFQSKEVNYYYLQVEVDRGSLKITMHRLDLTNGTAVWTQPDSNRDFGTLSQGARQVISFHAPPGIHTRSISLHGALLLGQQDVNEQPSQSI